MKYLSFFFIFILSNPLLASDNMHLEGFGLSLSKQDNHLLGDLSLSKANIVNQEYGSFRVGEDHPEFLSKIKIKERTLMILSDLFEYKIDLDQDNIISSMTDLSISNGALKLGSHNAKMTATSLNYQQKDINLTASNLSLDCPTELEFDTDIDKACLKNATIKASNLHQNIPMLNASIHNPSASISPSRLKLSASHINFHGGDTKAHANGVSIECQNTTGEFLVKNDFVKGCLKSGQIHIDRVDQDKKLKIMLENQKGLIDLDELSKIRLQLHNNYFNLRAKVKVLFRISFHIKGHLSLDNNKNLLTVNVAKATIAGVVPAKTLALTLMKLFLNSESVSVSGDNIIVKL